MKIVTLMENTACGEGLAAAHGLSLYIETPMHRILFDMGPNDDYLENARKLGVDLTAVDIAVLSHGHYDHGGGLKAFCALNDHAAIYVHRRAFGDYYALRPEQEPEYIGLDPTLDRERLILVGDELVIDEELTLFSAVPDTFGALSASARLREKTAEGYLPDVFSHEQDLVITAEGKTVLLAGCAHRGIVNIVETAAVRLGRRPDVTFGGFHLFDLEPGAPASEALIARIGRALLAGDTVYYTGHCTGEYAYGRLREILGERLRPMSGGAAAVV